MATIPHSVKIRARFDGRVFVPEEVVNLPKGSILEGWATHQRTSWPPGFIERTMGAWDGEELTEPEDFPPIPEDPFG